jgi:hypothetical protein
MLSTEARAKLVAKYVPSQVNKGSQPGDGSSDILDLLHEVGIDVDALIILTRGVVGQPGYQECLVNSGDVSDGHWHYETGEMGLVEMMCRSQGQAVTKIAVR